MTWRKLAWMADEALFRRWEIAAATMAKIHNAAATKRENLIRDWAELHPMMVATGGGNRSGAQQMTGSFNRAMCLALEQIEAAEKAERQRKA